MTKQQARTLIREIDSDPDRYLGVSFVSLAHLPAEVDPVWGKYEETYGIMIAADCWQDTVYDYNEARAVLRDLR